jgi:hypothetical protein
MTKLLTLLDVIIYIMGCLRYYSKQRLKYLPRHYIRGRNRTATMNFQLLSTLLNMYLISIRSVKYRFFLEERI